MSRKKIISSVFLSLLLFITACTNNTIVDGDNPEVVDLSTYKTGAENPLVVLEEYSDFFCPHCANVQPILKLLLQDFPDTLAIDFHAYSFMGSEYVHSGNECAGEQNKYWEFLDKAFEQQAELRSGNKSEIVKIAEEIGINTDQFKTCLDSNKYLPKIEKLKDEAVEKYDINSTPSFVIDGKLVEIAAGKGFYEGLKEIIEGMATKPFA